VELQDFGEQCFLPSSAQLFMLCSLTHPVRKVHALAGHHVRAPIRRRGKSHMNLDVCHWTL
jgi:hypothetical protein